MVDRVNKRIAFGKPLAEQGVVQQQIALSRNEIDHSRFSATEPPGGSINRSTRVSKRVQVAQIKAVARKWPAT